MFEKMGDYLPPVITDIRNCLIVNIPANETEGYIDLPSGFVFDDFSVIDVLPYNNLYSSSNPRIYHALLRYEDGKIYAARTASSTLSRDIKFNLIKFNEKYIKAIHKYTGDASYYPVVCNKNKSFIYSAGLTASETTSYTRNITFEFDATLNRLLKVVTGNSLGTTNWNVNVVEFI